MLPRRILSGLAPAILMTISARVLAADPAPAAKQHGAADPAAISALIQKGQEAFDAGDLDKARDAFTEALDGEPNNLTAGRDLGIVLVKQDKATKAAHPLEVALKAKSLDRSLVLALAAQRVSTKVPMQAVKYITVYCDTHPTPDEQLMNALGIALAAADAAGTRSALFTDAGKAYKKLNTRLEATRPGERRWGTEWMAKDEVEKKESTLASAMSTIKTDAAAVRKLDAQIADTQRQKDAVLYTEGNNNQTAKKEAFQKQIDQLTVQRDKTQKELDTAQKTLDDTKPKWPETVPTDTITLAVDPK